MNAKVQGKAIATVGPMEAIRHQLIALAPQFKAALPSNVTVERFVQVTMTAVAQNPKMAAGLGESAYTRRTFYSAAAKCAQDGLIPDGREAAFVTFNNKAEGALQAQYFPMIAGILKKIRNSGELIDITAHVVYEHDEFDYQLGDKEDIHHRPLWRGDRGKPVAAYAIAHTKNEGTYREVMTEAQIQAVRNVSRAKDDGPWTGDFADEMRRKTVLRRLSKRLPMSSDLAGVVHADDDLFDFPATAAAPEAEIVTTAAPAPAASKPSRTREAVLGKGEPDGRPEPPPIEGESKRAPPTKDGPPEFEDIV